MRIHRNTKPTPASRPLLVQRVRHQGWTIHAASAVVGVSQRTGGCKRLSANTAWPRQIFV